MMALVLCCLFVLLSVGSAGVSSVICAESLYKGRAASPISGRDTAPLCDVYDGIVPGALSTAEYSDTFNATGWADLKLYSIPAGPASSQLIAYSAGFLEGYLTAQPICDFTSSLFQGQLNGNETQIDALGAFLLKNYDYIASQTATNLTIYWAMVSLTYSRLEGLVAGHTANPERSCTTSVTNVLIINGQGGNGDILQSLFPSLVPQWFNMSEPAVREATLARSHCSVHVRFTPDMTELFSAQNMWWSYSAMLRVFKLYSFEDPPHPGNNLTVQFSSYPGLFSSTDDFYSLPESGLVVMETTEDVFNATLYTLIKPEGCVLSWVRVFVANALTRSGPNWASIFSAYNSGDYNNMWIVVNYNLFVPGKPLVDNTLVIVEQLPGLIITTDVTTHLNFGYFPSYNRAYSPVIFSVSGTLAMQEKFGNYYSYHGNPRATIFRRDAFSVMTVKDLQTFMQYNDWEHDPLSLGDAANQIAARYDLSADSPSAGGAIDAKITSASMLREGTVLAISGPTHQQQPVFTWASQWASTPHNGQPLAFDFDWVLFTQ